MTRGCPAFATICDNAECLSSEEVCAREKNQDQSPFLFPKDFKARKAYITNTSGDYKIIQDSESSGNIPRI